MLGVGSIPVFLPKGASNPAWAVVNLFLLPKSRQGYSWLTHLFSEAGRAQLYVRMLQRGLQHLWLGRYIELITSLAISLLGVFLNINIGQFLLKIEKA